MTAERHLRELLPDYALGALEGAELERVEAHLRSCTECREEVREYRDDFAAAVDSLPAPPVPATAWGAISERVGTEPKADGSEAGARRGSARRSVGTVAPAGRRARPVVALALACLALTAGAGIWGGLMWREARSARLHETKIARWLAAPDVKVLALPGEGLGTVLLRSDGRALFVLTEPPAAGSSYQAWGHREGGPVSLGVFDNRVFEVPVEGFEAVGVSLEPAGGSPLPTRPLGRVPLS